MLDSKEEIREIIGHNEKNYAVFLAANMKRIKSCPSRPQADFVSCAGMFRLVRIIVKHS